MKVFENSFHYKLIYIFEINDATHKGLLKIGDATIKTAVDIKDLSPNCKLLNQAARARIKEYTNTAGIDAHLLYTELAIYRDKNNLLKAFRDYDVHNVLLNSNIKKKSPKGSTGQEWFKVEIEEAIQAIKAVKQNKNNLSSIKSAQFVPIIFRPEQEEAITLTVKQFKKSNKFLWTITAKFFTFSIN